jgi:hypothetical protein
MSAKSGRSTNFILNSGERANFCLRRQRSHVRIVSGAPFTREEALHLLRLCRKSTRLASAAGHASALRGAEKPGDEGFRPRGKGWEKPSQSDWTLISGSEARCVPFAPDHRLLCDYADIAAFIRICDRALEDIQARAFALPLKTHAGLTSPALADRQRGRQLRCA